MFVYIKNCLLHNFNATSEKPLNKIVFICKIKGIEVDHF